MTAFEQNMTVAPPEQKVKEGTVTQDEVTQVNSAPEENSSKTAENPHKEDRIWIQTLDKFSYKGVVNNVPFLIFVALLAIVYIANNNHAISLVRNLNQKTKELKQLRWHYKDVQSRLMYRTSESQLKIMTEGLGLKPLEEPAFEIRIKTDEP